MLSMITGVLPWTPVPLVGHEGSHSLFISRANREAGRKTQQAQVKPSRSQIQLAIEGAEIEDDEKDNILPACNKARPLQFRDPWKRGADSIIGATL
jgi:hypothetical protein